MSDEIIEIDEDGNVSKPVRGPIREGSATPPSETAAVIDGLCSPCARCRKHPVRLDYLVSDAFWQRVVPWKWSPAVLCFDCLSEISGGVPASEIKKVWLTSKNTAAFIREPTEKS